MVLGTIIFAGVAGVMLGWNVHVMRKNGVCCPPPRADGTPGSSSRAVSESPHLRRRRHRSSSSRNRSYKDKEADLRRRAKKAGVGGGGSGSTKVMMDAVQEQQEEAQQAPAFGMSAEATGSVNGGGEGAPQGSETPQDGARLRLTCRDHLDSIRGWRYNNRAAVRLPCRDRINSSLKGWRYERFGRERH